MVCKDIYTKLGDFTPFLAFDLFLYPLKTSEKQRYREKLVSSNGLRETHDIIRGGCRDFEKGALYVGHHGWPTKKLLGFRWSKKAKITVKLKSF